MKLFEHSSKTKESRSYVYSLKADIVYLQIMLLRITSLLSVYEKN